MQDFLPRAVRAGALSLAILAVACAGKDQQAATPPDSGYDALQATRLFSVGYNDISDIYIEQVDISELALAGLERLQAPDAGFRIDHGGGELTVRIHGRPAASFDLPASGNADAWGSVTASVLDVGLERSSALDGRSAEQLYATVFDGVVSKLDSYSRYAGARRAEENRANRDGFGGIGVRIDTTGDGIRVVSVMDGSPAEAAGLQPDDRIVAIDGTAVADLTQAEVVGRLRGRLNTLVELTVRRAAREAPLRLAVTRAHIVPETVAWRREGNAAYIRISGFNQDTVASLRDAIASAKRRVGPDLSGFVLDLRGNPGGLLDQAVNVADAFVTKGRIVSTHGRHPDSHQYFEAEPDDIGAGLPIAVLVNSGSASASEIVAAALQDAGRAVVIGSTSYGKGTVQTVLRLPNEGELTLTWARFHAPSGYALGHRGVLPDVCTSGPRRDLHAVVAALHEGSLPLSRELQSTALQDDGKTPGDRLRERCPATRTETELDLEIARRLLADRELYRIASGQEPSAIAQVHH